MEDLKTRLQQIVFYLSNNQIPLDPCTGFRLQRDNKK